MKRILGAALLYPLFFAVGCSSGGGTLPNLGTGNSGNNGGTGSTGSNNGGAGSTIFNVSGGSTSSGTSVLDQDASCAASTIPASLTRVNILFLLDKSGSMGDDPNGQWQHAATRWNPVVTTLDNFFGEPSSAGIYASLSFLPADGDITNACKVTSYSSGSSSLKVPLTQLNAAGQQVFLSLLCPTTGPQTSSCIVPAGGTPTRPALQGTINYAATIQAQFPDSKTVIVFLTDGEPGFGIQETLDAGSKVYSFYSCDDLPPSTCEATPNVYPPCVSPDAEVAKVTAVIQSAPANSIYLVGVGDLTSGTMDAWASASGNPALALQNVTDPTQVASALQTALDAIRVSSIPCEFDIPASNNGQTVDKSKVNLSYVSGAGVTQDVGQTHDDTEATCNASTYGWYYDNSTAQTTMKLCQSTCDALQADPNGKIEIALGCATRI